MEASGSRHETYLGDERAVRPADLRGRRHGGNAERGVQVGLAGVGRVGCGGHRRGCVCERGAVTSKARERCADEGRADAEGGLRIRGGRRTEGRVAFVVAVSVRGVARGACVEVTRASDATTGRRAEENAEKAKTGGGEPAKRLEGRFDRADRRGTDAFHRDSMGQRVPTRRINYIPFRLAWRPQKAQRRENPQPARASAIPRRPARARASDPHHGVPQRHG